MSDTIDGDYKIPLTRGMYAIVDPGDYGKLSAINWWAEHSGNDIWYARGEIDNKKVRMHRYLLNLTDKGYDVDHINGDTLDNRKSNLRVCLRSENAKNRRGYKAQSSSKYKGVFVSPTPGKWCAQIRAGRSKVHLGTFSTEEAAAEAYNKKAKELHGDFAKLNNLWV